VAALEPVCGLRDKSLDLFAGSKRAGKRRGRSAGLTGMSLSTLGNALAVEGGALRRSPQPLWPARGDGSGYGGEHAGLRIAGWEGELDFALQLRDAHGDFTKVRRMVSKVAPRQRDRLGAARRRECSSQ
jgi:hypothetical protein